MALTIVKVDKSVLPRTIAPGRTRKPSEFDPIMDEAYADREWRKVLYDGTKNEYDDYVSELIRAVQHRGYGKSIRGPFNEETGEPYRDEDGNAVFYFLVRDRLKTGRRPKAAQNGDVVEDESDAEDEEESDTMLADVAKSVEDAVLSSSGGKRARKGVSTGG